MPNNNEKELNGNVNAHNNINNNNYQSNVNAKIEGKKHEIILVDNMYNRLTHAYTQLVQLDLNRPKKKHINNFNATVTMAYK